jgi:hypothetical protein
LSCPELKRTATKDTFIQIIAQRARCNKLATLAVRLVAAIDLHHRVDVDYHLKGVEGRVISGGWEDE